MSIFCSLNHYQIRLNYRVNFREVPGIVRND